MAVKHHSVGIKISFRRSNVGAHLRWLQYLAGEDFGSQVLARWKISSHLSKVRKIAQQVLEEEIYNTYQPSSYRRTYDTLRSVAARFLASGDGTSLYLDPAVIPAKGPIDGVKGEDSKLAYAAFFERLEFNSFIRAESPTDVIRHRPFFHQLTETFNEEEERQALRSLRQAIKYQKPRAISK